TTAMNDEQRSLQPAHGRQSVEEVSGKEVQRETRERHAGQIGEVRERRLQHEPVEGMVLRNLRGHGTAKGESIQERRYIFRPDLIVEAGRTESIRDDPRKRRVTRAAAESAIVERQD